jgi:hypothetical protein
VIELAISWKSTERKFHNSTPTSRVSVRRGSPAATPISAMVAELTTA